MIDWNKNYDEFSLDEIIFLYEKYGERVILQDGHVIGFQKGSDSMEV